MASNEERQARESREARDEIEARGGIEFSYCFRHRDKLWQSHGRSIEDPVFDYQDGLDEHGFKPGE